MKNKYRIKKFCAFFLIVCMVIEIFALPGIVGVFAQNTGETASGASASAEIAADGAEGAAAGDIADDTAGDVTGDIVGDTTGDTTGDTAGGAADETEGSGTDETSGDVTGETEGSGTDKTSGDVTDETEGSGTDETSGDVTDETEGSGTDETSGDVTDETEGSGTDETSGDVTDETAEAPTDETSGAGAGGTAGGAAGAGTDPAAKPAEPTKEETDDPWTAMTDEELAAWLMDEANAEEIKGILIDNTGEKYLSLHERLEIIFAGQDTERAEQVHGRLAALLQSIQMEVPIATYSNADPYIYFDLAAGNVTIGRDTYSGYIYVDGKETPVTGDHLSSNKYYVYQSNLTDTSSAGYYMNTGYTTGGTVCRLPGYERVENGGESWTEYITNNTDVEGVSIAWNTAAANIGRTGTPNNITFKSESSYTADVTIDNIWSTYHTKNHGRATGGIGAELGSNTDTIIRLRLKGDNRVGCVHYYANKNCRNQIIFSDGENGSSAGKAGGKDILLDEEVGGEVVLLDDVSDAEDISLDAEADIADGFSDEAEDAEYVSFDEYADGDKAPGSITVADFPKQWNYNHWNAIIGASDNRDCSDGIVIESGVIYAGSTWQDNCTAIGGGGNAYGGVTISGGTVTAVAATTGTAIGGGIGWGDKGGNASVTISNGTVYAYNFGIGSKSEDNYEKYVPAVAIGGGSSQNSKGNEETTVTITGGKVYAESMGGAAIGGGGSAKQSGGGATINITGGTVIAKSTEGEFKTTPILAGVSIGGGTGKTGGGSVTLNISGENTVLRTGSIGGGKCTGDGNIGSATVKITGGDITGQVIMAGGPGAECSFTMSGGTIHGTNVIDGNDVGYAGDFADPRPDVKIQYLEKNGGAVWMEDPKGVTNISGGTIVGCTAELGGAIYMKGGKFYLSDGGVIRENEAVRSESEKDQGFGGGVYVTGGNAWIKGGSICENAAQIRGGGVYVFGGNVTVEGGSISENKAGIDFGIDDVGRGGGVYLEGGEFTMNDGKITGNQANYRGGGIFLTQSPNLAGGTIFGNKARDGGGLCINGDMLELNSPNMKIYGNTAEENGGGVAVLNGEFILDGGNVGVEGESPNYAVKGGGVFVKTESDTANAETDMKADVTVKSGNIWYNSAVEGGGVYLDKGEGNFRLEGAEASINNNSAANGAGIYLYKDPILNQGKIELNTASENGGGMYISDCIVTLNPESEVTIIGNSAVNGGGIYIHDSSPGGSSSGSGGSGSGSGDGGNSGSGGSVDAISSATIPTGAVGLLVDDGVTGTVTFTSNTATVSGGAVCVDKGYFILQSDKITITDNAADNGGGVAVLKGNFTMSNGSIGEKEGANTAANGGGVYVSDGEVWLKGGSVQYNEATDGGGAYVTAGRLIMMDGSLINNTASQNGGGGYVAGNFRMLGGTVGGPDGGNSATNGGGVYVNDGNVTIVDGVISHNSAAQDGGGVYVSAASDEVKVVMLSGELNDNTAEGNGGGMAVESESSNQLPISVEIGCLRDHGLVDGTPRYPIKYEGDVYGEYEYFEKNGPYKHESCPEVKNNTAGGIGGGFFMSSDASVLSFYCVNETGNKAATSGQGSDGMDVVGGRVVIGDEYYHNRVHDGGSLGAGQGVPWGYISMDNSTLVTGGVVDIYGDMTNPIFRDEVTVDIEDKNNDHFMDHRLSNEGKHYKVHYFENFEGGGLYQARQYDEGNTKITIEGALFTHPGYRILGWYTKSEYNPAEADQDKDNRFYEVGQTFDLSKDGDVPNLGQNVMDCPFCEKEKDGTLLILYAIWEANGYTVVFDPNVPQEDTYTGEMKDQIHQYGVEQELTKNEYKYPGHIFDGWNTKADGSGTAYGDGEKVSNLTDKNGEKVRLYAQWKLCDHDKMGVRTYTAEGATLTRTCSCGGQTLTATLSAEDTVYDGQPHPATLTLSDEEAWGKDKPKIEYTATWSNAVHKGVDTTDDLLDNNKEPFHAGRYTAAITKPDGDSDNKAIASITYIIDKADQPAPEKPTYTVNGNQLEINKLEKDPQELEAEGIKQDAMAQYRLTYYVDSKLTATKWEMMPENDDTLPITMTTAWTSYNVEVRYEELNDYKPSNVTRADAVYNYKGNVTVKIICDEGISYLFKATEKEGKFNGATLELTIQDGYYIVGGEYSVKKRLTTDTEEKPEELVKPEKDGLNPIYRFDPVEDNSTLTITIGTARREPKVEAKVAPGQVFHSVTGTSAAISRDSAFTAAFRISNFDPYYTDTEGNLRGVYAAPELTFNSTIPEDTTIILLDRGKNGEKTYWYYRVEDADGVGSVPLTYFRKMGENATTKYAVPEPGQENGYIDLNYQFIVDFSQSANGCSGDSLVMTLKAEVNNFDTKAPEVKQEVTVSMADPSFELKNAGDANGLTQSLDYTFSVAPDAKASRWENRASALILMPKAGSGADDLPPDARIKAEVNGTTAYLYKTGGSFIVPLSLLEKREETVKLTLQSALFPQEKETRYEFTAEWLISPSRAGKAPKQGDRAGSIESVIFVSAKKAPPSLKPTGRQRALTVKDQLKVKVEALHMDGYTISAALLRKGEDGTYSGTGWNKTGVKEGDTLSVSLGGQLPGSFCLMFTVKQENSVINVMEVPYYFVIKPTQ